MSALLNVDDYLAAAAAKVDPAVWCYFEGGAGDEVTLRANVASFRRWQLRPRMLVDVSGVRLETTLLGTRVSMPLGVAPFAMQRLIDPEGELATARAAAAADVLMCVSTLTTRPHEEIAAAGPGPRWLQLYVLADRQRTLDHLAAVAGAGYAAVVLTVDLPYVGRRERDLRLGFENPPSDLELPYANLFETSPALTWRDLEWVRGATELPLVLKGILTREDATLAVEHGAGAVWVSNHGGRQLDGAPASLSLVAPVSDAVGGRVEIICDGGVRRGSDIVKAVAAGANACMAGRAYLYALGAGGERGVDRVLDWFAQDVRRTLALLGVSSIAELDRSFVAL